jgi:hypothetical protein
MPALSLPNDLQTNMPANQQSKLSIVWLIGEITYLD